MAILKIQETEKSFNQQSGNTYVLVAEDVRFDINKIELKKALVKSGVEVVDVRVVNPYKKVKTKGKKRTSVFQSRPKKFFVKLQEGKKLKEDFKLEIK